LAIRAICADRYKRIDAVKSNTKTTTITITITK
jgi:hypothetical protein